MSFYSSLKGPINKTDARMFFIKGLTKWRKFLNFPKEENYVRNWLKIIIYQTHTGCKNMYNEPEFIM